MNILIGISVVAIPTIAIIVFAIYSARKSSQLYKNRDAQNHQFLQRNQQGAKLYQELQKLLNSSNADIQKRFRGQVEAAWQTQSRLLQTSSQQLMKAATNPEKADEMYQKMAEDQQANIDQMRSLHDQISQAKINGRKT